MTTPQPAIPNAVDLSYRLWLWFDERVTSMPRAAQHTTGARMVSTSESLMECLVRATYAKRGSATRASALAQANVHVAMLRLLTRGCRERRHLSVGQYEHGTERLVELGRMIGGWQRAAPVVETP
ncbi:MAG: four helix bundle protein [Polyangiales bacterium]